MRCWSGGRKQAACGIPKVELVFSEKSSWTSLVNKKRKTVKWHASVLLIVTPCVEQKQASGDWLVGSSGPLGLSGAGRRWPQQSVAGVWSAAAKARSPQAAGQSTVTSRTRKTETTLCLNILP